MKASKIAKIIEDFAPKNLAESWDNIGFQLGSNRKEVKKVLTVLDINNQIADEAIEKDIDMIVSHHPLIFRGIKNIDTETDKGRLIEKLIKNDITVYSAHTNFDKAQNGINEYLAKLLGLKKIKPLKPDTINQNYYKIIVYVPKDHTKDILKVFEKYSTGKLSEKYQNCTFRTSGMGTFESLENSNPFIRTDSRISEVEEEKVETIIPQTDLTKILNDLKKAHPYEEMAYDLFPVKVEVAPKEGLGRIGSLQNKLTSDEFINLVKEKFELNWLREAGPRPKSIKKVALCSGAGSEFIQSAKNKGADVYITGDLKYHEAQTARELGLWVLDAGHFGTEKQVIEILADLIKSKADSIEVIKSETSEDYINLA